MKSRRRLNKLPTNGQLAMDAAGQTPARPRKYTESEKESLVNDAIKRATPSRYDIVTRIDSDIRSAKYHRTQTKLQLINIEQQLASLRERREKAFEELQDELLNQP